MVGRAAEEVQRICERVARCVNRLEAPNSTLLNNCTVKDEYHMNKMLGLYP